MKTRIFALLLLFALLTSLLAGCSNNTASNADINAYDLPEPAVSADEAFYGEQWMPEEISPTFYYVSQDAASLTPVVRTFSVSQHADSLVETIVRDLLAYASDDTILPALKNVDVLDVEITDAIVTVDLSLEAYQAGNEQTVFLLLASITNTLLSLDRFEGVNLLIDHKPLSMDGLPMGTRSEPFSSIMSTYAQFSAEREFFIDSVSGTIHRNALLYFPAVNGIGFVPVMREMELDSEDYASALIRELRYEPERADWLCAVMPDTQDLLVNNPSSYMLSDGTRVLHLDFSPSIKNYIALSGLTESMIYGSVVLTLMSFIPDIDAIEIQIGDEMLRSLELDGSIITFEDALICRSDFSGSISGITPLYVPNETGGLSASYRPVPHHSSHSLYALLQLLMPLLSSYGEQAGCSGSIEDSDILGVKVEGGVAAVNLSASFYRYAQQLTETQEKQFVYSIVNSLCALPEIYTVRILFEGVTADVFSHNIYLRTELYPNEGAEREAVS